jgi:hypothetical protein
MLARHERRSRPSWEATGEATSSAPAVAASGVSHLHVIALDGAWREEDGELAWEGLGHLRTSEVGEVLERLVRRMERHLRRSGQLRSFEDEADGEGDPEGNLRGRACGEA